MFSNKFKRMLHKVVIKHYQKAQLNLENELNKDVLSHLKTIK